MFTDGSLIAALLAVDPAGLGGVAVRSPSGDARDEWLRLLRELLPAGTPLRRIPSNIDDTALLGGLDLGATLQAGRPVAQQGVLAQSDGGVILLPMAERLSAGFAARLAAVMDTQEVAIQRDGIAVRRAARLGVVALDEGASDDEHLSAALLDRLAFRLFADSESRVGERADLDRSADSRDSPDLPDSPVFYDWDAGEVARARLLLPRVIASAESLQALCAAAMALGADSLRAPLLALRVARAAAALAGQNEVLEEHVAVAARLVLAPRATRLPADESQPGKDADDEQAGMPEQDPSPADAQRDDSFDKPSGTEPAPPESGDDAGPADDQIESTAGNALAETVLEAARAAIPAGLLAALKIGKAVRARVQAAGRSGAAQKSQTRGRPMGVRKGEPKAGARLNVIETLRAAAPWQRLRQREQSQRAVNPRDRIGTAAAISGPAARLTAIDVRREDFHVTRFKQVSQTTTLFVVDASGSSALNRLAEAKGAVELLLADCYVRRDKVAVLAFRGQGVELLLPPTRSLARAKRSLAGLPGGGGTPLALAIDTARELAEQISRRGETPILVLLTDGRGNIARGGLGGRERAGEDALAAARQLRLAGVATLLLDTSAQPQPVGRLLAGAMGATYLPLPHAGAQLLSQAVRAASGSIS